MKLLYAEEHCSCFNYEGGEGRAIEVKYLKKGDTWNQTSKHHKIVFVLNGLLRYDLGDVTGQYLSKSKMLLYPSDVEFEIQALNDSEVIIIRLPVTEQLCDVYSFEKLLTEKIQYRDDIEDQSSILDINERMGLFLEMLRDYVAEGLRCTYFFQIKIKEMLFILRAYYAKEDLLHFFYPLLTSDMTFSEFILKHKHEVRTVKEFAELSNYSLSGFQKRFKKVFGISAHKWLNEHRSKSILHEINNSERTLKEISNKYGFSSQSYFNDFCKTNFGSTPGQLRNQKTR